MMVRRILCTLASAIALIAYGNATSAAPRPPHYVLRSLDFPSGMALPQRRTQPFDPPLALAANGAVAALAVGFRGGYETSATHIVIWRADGSRAVIALPSQTVLAGAMYHRVTNTDRAFPFVEFVRVVLAADGTPFATVSSVFSGAYTGSDVGIFRWTGTRWTVVASSHRPPFTGPPGYRVAAAELPNMRVAVTRDYSGDVYNVDAADRDPDYHADEAWILTGKAWRRLGFGHVTSLAGAFACGYVSYVDRHPIIEHPGRPQLQPIALLWNGGAVTRLGSGVAFGVNAKGMAVGDDRTTLDGMTVRVNCPAPSTAYRRYGKPEPQPSSRNVPGPHTPSPTTQPSWGRSPMQGRSSCAPACCASSTGRSSAACAVTASQARTRSTHAAGSWSRPPSRAATPSACSIPFPKRRRSGSCKTSRSTSSVPAACCG